MILGVTKLEKIILFTKMKKGLVMMTSFSLEKGINYYIFQHLHMHLKQTINYNLQVQIISHEGKRKEAQRTISFF